MNSLFKYAGAMAIAAVIATGITYTATTAPALGSETEAKAVAACNSAVTNLQTSVRTLANEANKVDNALPVWPFRVALNATLDRMDAVDTDCSSFLNSEQMTKLTDFRSRYLVAYENEGIMADLGFEYGKSFQEAESILEFTYSIGRK